MRCNFIAHSLSLSLSSLSRVQKFNPLNTFVIPEMEINGAKYRMRIKICID